MPTSATDRRGARGTWLRLATLLLLVVLALAPSAVDVTSALLTDTATTSTVIWTQPSPWPISGPSPTAVP